jgi:hypothetical protein
LGSNCCRELPGVASEHPDQEERCAASHWVCRAWPGEAAEGIRTRDLLHGKQRRRRRA